MKFFFAPIRVLSAVALLALVPGCMTNSQFHDSELTMAGFKAVAATTPAQKAHLKALPAHKITKIDRHGKTYYVTPDVRDNRLYVGRPAEYAAYRHNQKTAVREDDYLMESQDAFVGDDAYLSSFDDWGPWNGLPWGGY